MTASEEKIAGLTERVEKATGPDRDLDVDIAWALEPQRYASAYWNGRAGKPGTTLPLKIDGLGRLSVKSNCPAMSGSIDAALALVGRVLPGWLPMLDQYPKSWTVNLARWDGEHWQEDVDAEATTAPLALILALLRALQSPDKQEGV